MPIDGEVLAAPVALQVSAHGSLDLGEVLVVIGFDADRQLVGVGTEGAAAPVELERAFGVSPVDLLHLRTGVGAAAVAGENPVEAMESRAMLSTASGLVLKAL